MARIFAIPIESVLSGGTTGDGNVVLLKLKEVGATEMTLAFPIAEAPRLLEAIAAGASTAMKIQGEGQALASEAAWFEIDRDENGRDILSVTFGMGGKMWFRLPRGRAFQSFQALGVGSRQFISQSSERPTN